MFCPECGKEIEENVNFCMYCGFKLIPSEQLSTEQLIHNVLIRRIEGIKNRNPDAVSGVVIRDKYSKFDDWPPFELQETDGLANEAKALKSLKEYEYETRSWKVTVFDDSAIATFIIKYRGTIRDLNFIVQSRVTAFLVKQDGEWKLVHEHWSRIPPPGMAEQQKEGKNGPILV
jgi:DNA-directed RNA polymerase subunit RPC12/RpoP